MAGGEVKVKWSEVAQSCPTLCDPMECSLPGSSVSGILQAGILEWVPSPGDLPNPGIEPGSPVLQANALLSEPPGKSIRGLNYHQFDFQINFLLVSLEGPPMWITFLRFLALGFQLGLPNQKQGLFSWLRVNNLLTMQEIQVYCLSQENPLHEDMATHSSILAWRIPWTEEPGGLSSVGLPRVIHNWETDMNMNQKWWQDICGVK